MRTAIATVVTVFGVVASAVAANPVTVELPEKADARTSLISIGDVAKVTGGTDAARAAVAALDLAEVANRDPAVTVSKRYVETRLRLAGFDARQVVVSGADRTTITPARRPVTPDEIVSATRAELMRLLPWPAGAVRVDLVQPIALALPEVPVGETLMISAKPRTKIIGMGKVQMDVVVSVRSERLISLGVYFEVKPILEPAPGTVEASSAPKPAANPNEVLVKARQRVSMTARIGEVKVTAIGEAQQDGRSGQTVLVQNVDSKKILSARVTGPGAVEVELGGAP